MYMDYQPHIEQYRKKKIELEERLADPAVLGDQRTLQEVGREYRRTETLLTMADSYLSALTQLKNAQAMLNESGDDDELAALAQEEVTTLEASLPALERALRVALIPPDPQDQNDAILEVRAGAGGDEAGLFAADLFKMYTYFAEKNGWKVVLISESQNDHGGFKEVIFEIQGDGAYGAMKFEFGVHRVQRVPETEKQGRVHTSTVTVAVLPKVEEKEFSIDPKDLTFETTTAQGAGGQHVNKTESAVRIVHIPTGTMVFCQQGRSQHQNRELGMEILRAKLFALDLEKKRQEKSDLRKSQIGSGDRSEKIRTYNFPQDRMTDHRIQESWHGLPELLAGNIDDVISALKLASETL